MILPILQTARLVLQPVAEADVDALWAIWKHPDVRRYLWDDRAIPREEAAATVDACLALGADGLGLWTLRTAHHGDAIVGCAGLLPVTTAATFEPRLAGLVEPLVALHPAQWRHGYATEALRALIEHARTGLGLERLAAVTDVPNDASDRMLVRAGFVPLSEVDGPRYRLRTYRRDTKDPHPP